MKHTGLILAASKKKRSILLMVCFMSIVCFSASALAQSGRRQTKNSSPSSPTPATTEPKTGSETAAPTVKPAASLSILVGGDKVGSTIYILSSYVDEVMQACMQRLKETQGLEVVGAGDMTRKAAIDRAKAETNAYVVWIDLRLEDDDLNRLSIGYSVYTPQTAKILTAGRIYPGNKSVGTGGVIIGVPSVTKRVTLQYQLKQGGQEVADRVRAKLRSNLPD